MPDGNTYQGNYHLGKAHGKGIYKWADGQIFEGFFFKGEILLDNKNEPIQATHDKDVLHELHLIHW